MAQGSKSLWLVGGAASEASSEGKDCLNTLGTPFVE